MINKNRTGLATPALTLLVLATTSGLAGAQAAVTIANYDFEQADPTGKLPANWVYIEPKDGDGFLTLGEGRKGGRSAQVTCTRRDQGWGPGFGQVGVVAVKGNQWYELRFWARAQGLYNGAFVALRDTTNWQANRLWQQFYPSSSWREFKYKFHSRRELPAKVSRLQFSFDSTGTLWVDDVRLLQAQPEKPANLLDVAGRKNLLPNSSFEVGSFGWATYGADELFGEIDTTTAFHGRRSFRITLEAGNLPVYYNDFTYRLLSRASHETIWKLPLCPIGYCPVESGKPLTFSFHLKASREGVPVVANIIEASGKATSRKFTVRTQWQRFSFSATPTSDMVFITLGIDASAELALPVALWMDALQLELAKQATEYQPTFPVAFGLDTGKEGNVYTRGEQVAPRLMLCNQSEAPQSASIGVEVEDFFGRRQERSEQHVALKAGEHWAQKLNLPITQPGFYRLNVTVSGEGWKTSRSLRAAVIYPFEREYAGADGFLGINHAFVSDLYMRRARAMGLTWVRSWFCKWEDVEAQQGTFDFNEARLQYERLRRLGMHVELCLSDPSSNWASTAPKELGGRTGGESQSRRVWWLPKSFDDYENYVRRVAEEFKGEVRHYEVFNEPTNRKGGENCNLDLAHTYPTFLERARRAIRSVSDEDRLMGAGLGYFRNSDDLSPIVEKIDILSEHRYPGLAPTASMLRSFAEAHEKLRESGGDRPIWVTEYGIYADDDPDPTTVNSRFLQHWGTDSERLAATYVAKHHIIALASGVRKVFFHIGNWPFHVNREHGCGFHAFFEWGGVPRKTYSALNTLAWVLPPGSRHVKTWTGPAETYAFEFEHGPGRVAALWSEGGLQAPAEALRSINRCGATFTDVSGAKIDRVPREIENSPIYIRATGKAQQKALAGFLEAMTAQGK